MEKLRKANNFKIVMFLLEAEKLKRENNERILPFINMNSDMFGEQTGLSVEEKQQYSADAREQYDRNISIINKYESDARELVQSPGR